MTAYSVNKKNEKEKNIEGKLGFRFIIIVSDCLGEIIFLTLHELWNYLQVHETMGK